MTEENKRNCLKLRYKFRDEFNDLRGYPQEIRHNEWLKYVNNSNLSSYEKQLCIQEFITLEKRR